MTPQTLTYKIASNAPQELSPSYDPDTNTGSVYALNLSTSPLTLNPLGAMWDGKFAPMGRPEFVERLVRDFLEASTTPQYLTDRASGVNIKRVGPPYFVLN